ncbi:MAG: toxin-antitoxin system HicB family antitoxin, partial [Aliifodinibius sp.]|nr:toxin-antitoxin system HicB family antitoxin [Fodinibius sp.]NIV14611.1 toxin-antitoxin system HicB family antitoxin [Fodinibius sp.]NIY28473.1 toxin-antitoxin system HicB family antitoxin [Fodinibius sp.]
IPPSLHKLLSQRAKFEHVSLNQFMATTLAKSVGISTETKKAKSREKDAC